MRAEAADSRVWRNAIARHQERRRIRLAITGDQIRPTPAAAAARGSDIAAFKSGVQTGDSAVVAGALRNGNRVVTSATGRVLTIVDAVRWLRSDLDIIRDQLYLSLYPGTNDPGKFATN